MILISITVGWLVEKTGVVSFIQDLGGRRSVNNEYENQMISE